MTLEKLGLLARKFSWRFRYQIRQGTLEIINGQLVWVYIDFISIILQKNMRYDKLYRILKIANIFLKYARAGEIVDELERTAYNGLERPFMLPKFEDKGSSVYEGIADNGAKILAIQSIDPTESKIELRVEVG